jgi:hypothetical protein
MFQIMALFVSRHHSSSLSAHLCVSLWIALVLLSFSCYCSAAYVPRTIDVNAAYDNVNDLNIDDEPNYQIAAYQSWPLAYSSYYAQRPSFRPSRNRLVDLVLKSMAVQSASRNQRPINTNKRYTAQAFHAMRG